MKQHLSLRRFSPPDIQAAKATAWDRIVRASMAIPGAKVDRRDFLYAQLRSYCDERQVCSAIEDRPANAGIAPELIDKLADSCIKSHVVKAAGISFAAGLPGGWFMAGTIPADLAQFYWHAIVLSQKLAYLYGWPDILKEGAVDEETELRITLLIGAMMGAHGAHIALAEVAERFAEQIARRLPRMALTKTAWYPVIKEIGKWIGIQVTKASFARGVAKVIPVVGGVVSAGVTVGMMRPMGRRLKDHLREQRLASSDDKLGLAKPSENQDAHAVAEVKIMASEYIDILRTELERQRQFLSDEEEQVLLQPASYESDDDLALDSVKRRQHTFVPILRDRFVRDGRPLAQWWDVLAEEERLPEDRTMIGAMVVQVLDWSARTSDQKAMMGGFASKLLLVAAVLIGFFGTFTLAVGAWPAGIVLLVITAALWVGARVLGHLTAERVGELVEEYKREPEPEEDATEGDEPSEPAADDPDRATE